MTLRNLTADRPSVTFDFRKSKQLDPRITFTRASYTSGGTPVNQPSAGTGTHGGTLQEFNVNVPRLTNKGLLIEESRTNDFQNSVFTQTSDWLTSSPADHGTVTANDATAPDGTNTAAALVAGAQTDRVISMPLTTTNDQTVFSFFVKKGTGDNLQFGSLAWTTQGAINYTFSTDTFGTNYNLADYGKEDYGNGWIRLWIRFGAAASGTVYVRWGDASPSGTTGWFWGVQQEQGAFQSSYIPTSGAAVTRARDVCEITGDDFSSWYAQGIGTLVSGWTSPDTKIVSAPVIIKSSTAKNSPGVIVYTYVGAGTARDIYGSVTGSSVDWQNVVTANTPLKLAITYDASTQSTTYNGNTPKSVAITTAVPTMIRMDMGDHYVNNDRYSNGYISHIAYYPTRLTDSALQALTN